MSSLLLLRVSALSCVPFLRRRANQGWDGKPQPHCLSCTTFCAYTPPVRVLQMNAAQQAQQGPRRMGAIVAGVLVAGGVYYMYRDAGGKRRPLNPISKGARAWAQRASPDDSMVQALRRLRALPTTSSAP